MVPGLCVGQEIANDLSRLIQESLEPENLRNSGARLHRRMIQAGTYDLSPANRGRAVKPCSARMRQRSNVVTKTSEYRTKHAVRRRDRDGIGRGFGKRFKSACERKRLVAFFMTNAENR